MQAAVKLDHQLLAVEGEHDVHAMLELSRPRGGRRPCPAAAAARARARPLRLDGRREARLAKRCAAWLVSRLRPVDELALVGYDDEVRLLAPLAAGARAPLAHGDRRRSAPGGSTNLSGGWLQAALEQLRRAPAEPRKILLLTDGLANVGITEPSALVRARRRCAGDGIGTTTIGFGADFDEELLDRDGRRRRRQRALGGDAGRGAGIFAAGARGPDERRRAERQRRDPARSRTSRCSAILNEYPQVRSPGGVQLALGDAYAGERRRIVFALHVPHLASLGAAERRRPRRPLRLGRRRRSPSTS